MLRLMKLLIIMVIIPSAKMQNGLLFVFIKKQSSINNVRRKYVAVKNFVKKSAECLNP